MTKKDYIKLAAALAAVKTPAAWDAAKQFQWQVDVNAIANVLAQDNGKFDRERFLRAAGAL